ncbi:MAG TPA: hypothetical protein VEG30_17535 [Terriglobales bacterium]|nr:hypothetical protein [Terriglobales bacterium]
MKRKLMLTSTSLLSILLMTFHLTQDTLHASYARAGTAEARGTALIVGVPILVGWLWGTLLLAERRSGHIIMLVGSAIALAMPVIHVILGWGRGSIVRSDFARTGWAFFFVWTLFALGMTGLFSLILAVRGLRSAQWVPAENTRLHSDESA